MYQALYRKWRPRTFDEVVGQAHITETLKRQVASGRLSHAYLFTGTRGTGKTSCAKIMARAVNCENPQDGNPCNACPACLGIENGSILDVLELDAASNNGVDQVRALRDEAVYTPAAVRKRVYIVDEVHMLSTPAFNALLKILEEPPEHLMFILATTELHKVPATIKSRCQQFAFKRILPGDLARQLSFVAEQESISLTAEGAALLARLADGGMRDALSLLDQCADSGGTVDEAAILSVLGLAGNLKTASLLQAIADHNAASALSLLGGLYSAGKEVGALLGELSALMRDLLLRQTAPNGGASLLTGGYDEQTMRTLSAALPAKRLLAMLALVQQTAAELPRSSNRRTDAEVCLIRLCDETLDDSLSGLNARLERLESLLPGGTATLTVPTQIAPPVAPPSPTPKAAEPPAPTQDDLPPFDLAPAPEKEKAQAPPPVRKAPPTTPKAPAAPQPSFGGPVDSSFWPSVVKAAKGKLSPAAYSFLQNPAMVFATADAQAVTLWVQSTLVQGVLNKSDVTEVLRGLIETKLGRSVPRLIFTVGKPPAGQAAPAADTPAEPPSREETHDKLDDLLALGQQFDNIIIEE